MMMLCQKTLNKIMMIKLMKMKWMNKNKYLNKMILRTKINKFLIFFVKYLIFVLIKLSQNIFMDKCLILKLIKVDFFLVEMLDAK